MTENLENLKKWVGEKETDIDYVTVPSVHRLAATLDREDPMPKLGEPLPIGWHQILFHAWFVIRRSVPMDTRRAAISCRRYRCREECSQASAIRFMRRSTSETKSDANL